MLGQSLHDSLEVEPEDLSWREFVGQLGAKLMEPAAEAERCLVGSADRRAGITTDVHPRPTQMSQDPRDLPVLWFGAGQGDLSAGVCADEVDRDGRRADRNIGPNRVMGPEDVVVEDELTALNEQHEAGVRGTPRHKSTRVVDATLDVCLETPAATVDGRGGFGREP